MRWVACLLLVATCLAVAGCSKGPAGPTAAGVGDTNDPFINQPAPATAGTSPSGQPVSLADQRGKVVVLVFWGSWCPPCMSMVPHERELMTRYSGQPFTLLGVNNGDSQSRAQETIAREQMNWPIIWDGEEQVGPIARTWQVQAWPTMYVIDPDGIVRHKLVGALPEDLDQAIAVEMAKLSR